MKKPFCSVAYIHNCNHVEHCNNITIYTKMWSTEAEIKENYVSIGLDNNNGKGFPAIALVFSSSTDSGWDSGLDSKIFTFFCRLYEVFLQS